MRLKLLLILATLGFTAADTSITSLFMFGANRQSLVGSVVKTESKTTTYSITCPSGSNSSDCGVHHGLLYTQGPTTVEWAMESPYVSAGDGHVTCSTGGSTSAVCTEMISTNGVSFLTETKTLNQSQITFLAVTITAGPSATSANTTATSADTTPSATSSGSGTGPVTGPASGDVPQITAPLQVIIGGLAVGLVAFAL
ncbi:GPI anchored protein [Penicillium sp. IBT 35674x]|nr:GPI anchored protein [Penicillium sp. IBT 35674x]